MVRFSLLVLLVSGALAGQQPRERLYRLSGKILQSDNKPFKDVVPVVFLYGATNPFTTRTLADRAGGFGFKNLKPGAYILVAAVPRAGEMNRTIEIGPTFADSKGKVELTLLFEPRSPDDDAHTVSATELSIPQSAWNLYERALKRLEKHDTEEAVALLKSAVEAAPHFAAAWNHLGTISYHARDYPEAEKYFLEALAQDPEAYSPLVNLGGTLLSAGRIDESLPINLKAVRARPDDALAHVQLGRSYFELGQLDKAEEQLREAKALDPAHFSLPQLTLIQIYERKQDHVAVVREIEDFLKQHPDSTMAPAMRKVLEIARSRAR
jgi:tetratricopeptide (TPR) repeat protein